MRSVVDRNVVMRRIPVMCNMYYSHITPLWHADSYSASLQLSRLLLTPKYSIILLHFKHIWVWVSIPDTARHISLPEATRSAPGSTQHRGFYTLPVKQLRREEVQTPQSSSMVRNEWSCTSNLPTHFQVTYNKNFAFLYFYV